VPSVSILGCHHHEGIGHLVGFTGDRDLALLHDLEQRALHLRRGTVDFVGQQQIAEHRPERGGEISGPLVVDAGADEVGRYEIGRELDTLEAALHHLGEGIDRQRLGETGYPFDQQMPLGQQRHQHALEEMVLADDDLLHLVEDLLHLRGNGGCGALRFFGHHLLPVLVARY
jgi:hypothetical protein